MLAGHEEGDDSDGPSYFISGGPHTGGELFVRQRSWRHKEKDAAYKYVNTRGVPIIFNGTCPHGFQPYQGERCAIAAYTHEAFFGESWSFELDVWEKLLELGYRPPPNPYVLEIPHPVMKVQDYSKLVEPPPLAYSAKMRTSKLSVARHVPLPAPGVLRDQVDSVAAVLADRMRKVCF